MAVAKKQGADATAVPETGEKFTFFFGAESPFSQWHPAVFTVDGVEYNCAEQYMMSQKAVLFADESVAAKIMASDDPREQKALGRKVSNFSDETWKKNCRKIVKKGNLAKVTSNHGKRLSKAQCKPPLKNPAISSGYILSTFLSHLLYIYMCMLLDVQFSQNSDLRAELLQTKGTTPVETGPRDTMWGIGLSAKSWKAQNRKYWRGKNLLGEILTEVRDELATGNDTND